MGHADDPERQHRDEERADAGVIRQAATPLQQADHRAHDDGTHRPACYCRGASDCCQGHSWQHPVTYGFAKEGHPSNDDPGADDTANDRDEGTTVEGPEEEVCGEGFS